MSTALWIAQALLALVFVGAGLLKLLTPRERLPEQMAAVKALPQTTIRLIGALEVLGAIGIVVPALTGILPGLTSWAALGLAATMIGAALTHARRGETSRIGGNAVLFVLALFVAWGRWGWT